MQRWLERCSVFFSLEVAESCSPDTLKYCVPIDLYCHEEHFRRKPGWFERFLVFVFFHETFTAYLIHWVMLHAEGWVTREAPTDRLEAWHKPYQSRCPSWLTALVTTTLHNTLCCNSWVLLMASCSFLYGLIFCSYYIMRKSWYNRLAGQATRRNC